MKDTLKEAIKVFGTDAQVELAIEEMSELTKALIKDRRYHRKGDIKAAMLNLHNVCEEIADVEVMTTQLRLIFDLDKEVDEIKRAKVRKLAEHLHERQSQ